VFAKATKGEDFAGLARTYSKDPGSAQQGGDLNYFAKGRMVPEFDSAVFAASVGSIVGPVETQFGYHIIKVAEKLSVEYKHSAITIKAGISAATKRSIAAAAEQAYQALQNGESIESVAGPYIKKFYAQLQETPIFSSETPVLQSRELTSWAFEQEVGAVIRRDIKYYGTVIAQVSDARESGVKPLADVKDKIKRILSERAKLAKLESQAKQIAAVSAAQGLAAARGGDTTITFATQTGIKDNGMISGFGNEYTVTSAAFTQPVGSVSKAIKGESGWFVIKVISRSDANVSDYAKNPTSTLQALSQKLRNSAFGAWFQKVREKADIKDKRFSQEG
jgi:parvulin-like peptidyl-prolyl isomerase